MVLDDGRDKSRPYKITIRNPKSARRAAASLLFQYRANDTVYKIIQEVMK